MIHFNECRSEEVMFLLTLSVGLAFNTLLYHALKCLSLQTLFTSCRWSHRSVVHFLFLCKIYSIFCSSSWNDTTIFLNLQWILSENIFVWPVYTVKYANSVNFSLNCKNSNSYFHISYIYLKHLMMLVKCTILQIFIFYTFKDSDSI